MKFKNKKWPFKYNFKIKIGRTVITFELKNNE